MSKPSGSRRRARDEPSVVTSLDLQTKAEVLDVVRRGVQSEVLSLDLRYDIETISTRKLVAHLCSLRSLELACPHGISLLKWRPLVNALSPCFSDLTSFRLSGCSLQYVLDLENAASAAASASRYAYPPPLPMNLLEHIVDSCKSLRRLDISFPDSCSLCSRHEILVSSSDLLHDIVAQNLELDVIRFHNTFLHLDTLHEFSANHPRLAALHLSGCVFLETPSSVPTTDSSHISSALVPSVPSLQSLTLRDCWPYNSDETGPALPPSYFSPLLQVLQALGPHLTYLDVSSSRCVRISDDGLKVVAALCPDLEHLDISIDNDIYCSRLLKERAHLRKITDEGVSAVAEGCRGLKFVGLRRQLHVTAKGLDDLLEKCEGLVTVHVLLVDELSVTSQWVRDKNVRLREEGRGYVVRTCSTNNSERDLH